MGLEAQSHALLQVAQAADPSQVQVGNNRSSGVTAVVAHCVVGSWPPRIAVWRVHRRYALWR